MATWGIDPEIFNDVIPLLKVRENVTSKTMLSPKAMKTALNEYKEIISRAGHKRELNALLEDPQLALILSINAVLDSWESGPARVYREREGLSHEWGTGVIVQRMRFGNFIGQDEAPSMTGVLFTRDVHNARLGLNGEYVLGSQGNDVVAGNAGHASIHSIPDEMKANFPGLYEQLERFANLADKKFRGNQDIEFTVEEGALYFLQSRDKPYEGEHARRLDPKGHRPVSEGVGVSGGGYRGVVGFIDSDLKSLEFRINGINGTMGKAKLDGIILFVNSPGNGEVNKMLEVKGWAVGLGGRTSHAALMAKQHGVHAIFGLSFQIDFKNRWVIVRSADGEKVLNEGDVVSIDGSPHAGALYRGSVPYLREDWQGEGESHGGVWPWMRALFAQSGISGKTYDRWFAWVVENTLSQALLGPLLAWSVGILALWGGIPLPSVSELQYAWGAFFLGHFAQQLWGKPAPSRSTIFSAALLALVGVGGAMTPFSLFGLAAHFGLNLVTQKYLSTHGGPVPTGESRFVGSITSHARADAARAAALVRQGGVPGREDIRSLLLPQIETPALAPVSAGLLFSRQTAQRLQQERTYRHAFAKAFREELNNRGESLPSIAQLFWSLGQASFATETLGQGANPESPVHVIEEIINEKDLPLAQEMIESVTRANAHGGAVPIKLLLVSSETRVVQDLIQRAQGNPHISIRSVPLTAERLSADFDQWRKDSNLQGVALRLVISLSDGVSVAGSLGNDSLYSRALRAALSEMAVRPIDIGEMLEVAAVLGQNA